MDAYAVSQIVDELLARYILTNGFEFVLDEQLEALITVCKTELSSRSVIDANN